MPYSDDLWCIVGYCKGAINMPTKTSKHDAYSLVTIRPILRTKHQQQHHVHFPLVCQGWTLPFHQGLNGSMRVVHCSWNGMNLSSHRGIAGLRKSCTVWYHSGDVDVCYVVCNPTPNHQTCKILQVGFWKVRLQKKTTWSWLMASHKSPESLDCAPAPSELH